MLPGCSQATQQCYRQHVYMHQTHCSAGKDKSQVMLAYTHAPPPHTHTHQRLQTTMSTYAVELSLNATHSLPLLRSYDNTACRSSNTLKGYPCYRLLQLYHVTPSTTNCANNQT
jgi:hypothetical protein